jgi:type II secretory pathway pseudopilin PulG
MHAKPKQLGFSLIEIVIFIVVVGVAVAGITLQFTQNVKNSATPLLRQKAIAIANAYLDEMLHKKWDENSPSSGGCILTTASAGCPSWTASTFHLGGFYAQPTAGNGHMYQALNSGTTDTAEPAWPVTGGTVNDGSITWLDMGTSYTVSTTFGHDGEATRADYDDVDDYHTLDESPPKQSDGSNAPGYSTDYTVRVSVGHPAADPWNGIDASDVKEITITVSTTGSGETLTLIAHRLNY